MLLCVLTRENPQNGLLIMVLMVHMHDIEKNISLMKKNFFDSQHNVNKVDDMKFESLKFNPINESTI